MSRNLTFKTWQVCLYLLYSSPISRFLYMYLSYTYPSYPCAAILQYLYRVFFITFSRPWYFKNLNIVLPSFTFISLRFLHHIRITILLLPQYIIWLRLFIILPRPFRYISPSLSISPFRISVVLPFYY